MGTNHGYAHTIAVLGSNKGCVWTKVEVNRKVFLPCWSPPVLKLINHTSVTLTTHHNTEQLRINSHFGSYNYDRLHPALFAQTDLTPAEHNKMSILLFVVLISTVALSGNSMCYCLLWVMRTWKIKTCRKKRATERAGGRTGAIWCIPSRLPKLSLRGEEREETNHNKDRDWGREEEIRRRVKGRAQGPAQHLKKGGSVVWRRAARVMNVLLWGMKKEGEGEHRSSNAGLWQFTAQGGATDSPEDTPHLHPPPALPALLLSRTFQTKNHTWATTLCLQRPSKTSMVLHEEQSQCLVTKGSTSSQHPVSHRPSGRDKSHRQLEVQQGSPAHYSNTIKTEECRPKKKCRVTTSREALQERQVSSTVSELLSSDVTLRFGRLPCCSPLCESEKA